MANFEDLAFVANDYNIKKSPCWCGCPPPENEDVIQEEDSEKLISEKRQELTRLNFFAKPFRECSADELAKIREKIIQYTTFHKMSSSGVPKPIRNRRYHIQNVFETVIMFPELISIQDFLVFMEWTPEKNPREFYICLETVLYNGFYQNGRNWRDQSLLLDQVRVFFDVFGADVNHEFIDRHDSDGGAPGEIYFWKYPLHLALSGNMPKSVCAYLMERGADPALQNPKCNNAFYECLDNWHADVYDLFTPEMRQKLVTVNPFVWACSPSSPARIQIFEKLLQMGFDINQRHTYPPLINLFGSSMGNRQTNYRKFQIFKWMIETAKCDPNVVCANGRTLLHYICRSPYGWYCHPLVRQYVLDSPLFSWSKRDNDGISPCEYLIDYHLEKYPLPDEDFPECKLPNFLCQVILATGLRNITDAGMPNGMAAGERIRLAKTILFLKYQSLMQHPGEHAGKLIQNIKTQWHIFYCTHCLILEFPDRTQLQQMIYTIARSEVTAALASEEYRRLVRKIIMTALIIGEPNTNHVLVQSYNDDEEEDYSD